MVVTGRAHCSILLYSYGLFFLVLFCLDANRARLEKLRNHNSPHGQQTAVKLTDKIFVIWLFLVSFTYFKGKTNEWIRRVELKTVFKSSKQSMLSFGSAKLIHLTIVSSNIIALFVNAN